MCEKCVELDGKIEHYRDIALRMTDEAMIRGIKVLIERAKAQKAALHPKQIEQGKAASVGPARAALLDAAGPLRNSELALHHGLVRRAVIS